MNIQTIKLKDMNPAPYNPRKDLKPGDIEYQHINNSIKEFGLLEPIVWNKRTGYIVGGHQRYKILKEQGVTETECVVVDFDEEKEKAANIALNKAQGSWEEQALADLLSEIEQYDMTEFGFTQEEIDELLKGVGTDEGEAVDDDFDIDTAISEEPLTQRGDVWVLRRHRLMCGDSKDRKDVEVLMNGQKADLCVTDPPYNVDYVGKTKDELKIQNDRMEDAAFFDFLKTCFENMLYVMKDGAAIYVFHADLEAVNFRSAFKAAGFRLAQCCVWVKNSMVLGRQDYQWQHEPVLYGWKETGTHKWYSDRTQTTLWHFDRPTRSKEHPTMKPVPLIAYPIKNSSKEGDLIVDLFAGSGSTLIAAEQINRSCYCMEIDPVYCDVIIKRYAKAVGSYDDIYVLRGDERISYTEAGGVVDAE